MFTTISGACRHVLGLAIGLFTVCAAFGPAAAGTKVWTTHGPYGGVASTLLVDPKAPATLYEASPTGGVFKSTNRGASWVRSSTGLTDPTCFTLVMDPANHAVLYAAGGNGVFGSTDGAAHWKQVSNQLVNVDQLAIDPKSPSTLWAVLSEDPLYKSTDGGKTWTSQFKSLPSEELNVFAIDPKTPTNLYAGAFGGIYKSTDGGGKWSLIKKGMGTEFVDVTSLWIDPVTPSILYAMTGDLGLERSTDSGLDWKPVATGLSAGDYLFLGLDPRHPDTLYLATYFPPQLRISRNAGKSWNTLGLFGSNFKGNVTTLAIDPTKSVDLYTGTSEGVFASTDQGGEWVERNKGLSNTVVTAVAVDPKVPGTVYAGVEGIGIFKTVDAGTSWTLLYNADIKPVSILIDPTLPTTMYFGDEFGGGVFKSTNGGTTWTNILSAFTVFALAMDQKFPAKLYVSGGTASMYRSTNAGKTWAAANKGLPAGFAPTSVSAADNVAMTTSASQGVYFSRDGGTWAANDPVDPAPTPSVRAHFENFAVGIVLGALATYATVNSPPGRSALGFAGGIEHVNPSFSPNVTVTWTPWNAPTGVNASNCPPMTALAADPLETTTFYTGGLCGVLKGTNSGKKLAATNAGLPLNIPVNNLAVTPTNSVLYAGLGGAGVYSYTSP